MSSFANENTSAKLAAANKSEKTQLVLTKIFHALGVISSKHDGSWYSVDDMQLPYTRRIKKNAQPSDIARMGTRRM